MNIINKASDFVSDFTNSETGEFIEQTPACIKDVSYALTEWGINKTPGEEENVERKLDLCRNYIEPISRAYRIDHLKYRKREWWFRFWEFVDTHRNSVRNTIVVATGTIIAGLVLGI